MIRKFATLLTVLALFPVGVVQGQDRALPRKVFSSTTEDIAFPTVSPDAKWLLYIRMISNQESQLVIRPLSGGEPRVLQAGKAFHTMPKFTPQGDRIVLVSTLVRRDASDNGQYLLSAPFDTGTGTVTGSFRQVTLEPVRLGSGLGMYSISPDGRNVVYFAGGNSNTIRLVPVVGGNARTLANPRVRPGGLAWSVDGQAVFYTLSDPSLTNVTASESVVRMRVGLTGSAPTVVARSHLGLGMLAADSRHSFAVAKNGSRWTLRVFSAEGRLQGEVPIPGGRFDPVAGGKYLVGMHSDGIAPIKVVPVAGGPIKQVTDDKTYDWPMGWSPDGMEVLVASDDSILATVSRSGDNRKQLRIPEAVDDIVGQRDGFLIYKTKDSQSAAGSRIVRMRLKDGSTTELAGQVLSGCCDPVAAGGMYYGIIGDEFYYRQTVGDHLQVRAMTVSGTSRLLGEFPARLASQTGAGGSVFRDRLAYRDSGEDSVRLQVMMGPGSMPKTLDAFRPSQRFSVVAWSQDGRQLAVGLDEDPQRLLIYPFNDAGMPQGAPRALTLPFEYWYEVFWLPDGSGFTMIAQPRGMPMTHVALVKLADPEHPVLLTREDPNNKWGHSLSPDGKWVAYPSEQLKGSSIYLIEVAELLKRVGAKQ